MAASSSKGKIRVRSRGIPQKVQISPTVRITKEMRIKKNSDAIFPARKIRQAKPVTSVPRPSGTAGIDKVTLRRSHATYNASGGNKMPCDHAGSIHQSCAISASAAPKRMTIRASRIAEGRRKGRIGANPKVERAAPSASPVNADIFRRYPSTFSSTEQANE